MDTYDDTMGDFEADTVINSFLKPNSTHNLVLPSLETVAPLQANAIPPPWVGQTLSKKVHERGQPRNMNCQVVDAMEEDSATGKSENCCRCHAIGPKNEENTNASLATESLIIPGKLEDTIISTSMDVKMLQQIRSCLLKPLLSQGQSEDEFEENYKNTLLHLVEDKIYIYGFYERMKHAKTVGVKRSVCRKRGNVWEDAHRSKKHCSSGVFEENSSSGAMSFSFPSWEHDTGKISVEVEKLFSQNLHSAPLLAPNEKQSFSRYALSSGKLRKECADPYQFFTARLHERRQSLEEWLSAGENNEY
ncbi:hypothetical protein TraAM80_01738 [Trypanosoma rangeli]|uniref:Uncharacterized protein n=1 Tax=Trypanosoma rangeli TaxID=5698 RepID=A0A3R7KM12_TRYRA|nr:uncharacterized protein TraAM80_01738 [Trypanosoma rangeli]RNF10161.1 hypothetical protein TraAM80_01738 [Trypanosoma rangeli]|eukprot:RNF10161.1 hypothetical protein TraAM80_01738 [Trypanosoma rangeli]